jgi:hypothetical protein
MSLNEVAGRIGVYTANRISAQLPGVIFREQRSGDTGLHAHLEITDRLPKMGKSIGLQIRSGEDERVERGARGYFCHGDIAHLTYWLQHSIPVLVMVYERETDRVLWEVANADTVDVDGRKWELLVPIDQAYGPEAVQSISALPCHSPYLARLALDRPWMELLETGALLLEIDEWINRPSARGSLRLCVCKADGTREAVYEWAFQIETDMPYSLRLPELFPWANLSVDEEFYRDKTPGETTDHPEDIDLIRPWTVEAGEVAKFALKLSLNELGRSFLMTERFLRRGEFPRPPVTRSMDKSYEEGIKYRLYNKL